MRLSNSSRIEEQVAWPVSDAISGWRRYAPELVIAGVLLVVAFLARRHGLPTDGLWYDDTIPAAALEASPSQLLAAGARVPGFVLALMGWNHLTGGSDAGLAYPALIAGTLGPPLLYLALRGCGYERSISALLGAALAAAQTDIVYSGRVRTYTIETLLVLALAMIVPRLMRTRWRWQTGVAWAAAGIAMVFFSVFLLIPVAVASAIVVLRPASDLRVRAVAVGAQAGVCAALVVAEGSTYNNAIVADNYRRMWDAFVTFDLNPLRFGGEVFVHLRRLAETFPGGPTWFATLCIVAVLVGLVTAAWKGRHAIRARYLLLVLFVALVGGVLGKSPFGPTQTSPLSDGGRVSLWLIPVLAIGLAAALQGLRGLLADRRALRIGFDAVAYLATAAVLVSAGPALPYPFPGAKSATNFVESHLGQHDSLLIGYHANWSFAAESDFAYEVKPTPQGSVGFQPDFADPRVHYLDVGRHAELVGTELVGPRHVGPAVKHASRVFVYYAMPLVQLPETGARTKLASTLQDLGYAGRQDVTFSDATVQIWRRPGTRDNGRDAERERTVDADAANLKTTDLPQDWEATSASTNPLTTGILTCLHVSANETSQSFVNATTSEAPESVVSEVTLWQRPTAAQKAFTALAGPRASECIRTTLLPIPGEIGLSVALREVPPPPGLTDGAIRFAYSIRVSNGTVQSSFRGTLVFFTRGKAGVLINAVKVGEQPFPRGLLSSLAETVAHRVSKGTPASR